MGEKTKAPRKRRRAPCRHVSAAEKLLCVGLLVAIPLGAGAVYRKGRHYDPNLFALDPKLVKSLKRSTPAPPAPGAEPGEDAAGAPPPQAAAPGMPGVPPSFAVPGVPPTMPGAVGTLPAAPGALPPAALAAAAGGSPTLFGASFGDPQWALNGKVERFRADNMYEKIDGRAEHYLKYNAVGLQAASYADRRDPGRFIDVLVFDMAKPTNAFGVFTAERPENIQAAPLGDPGQAYRAETSYFFTRGRYYVQVVPSGKGKLLQDAGLKLAKALDGALGGAAVPAPVVAAPAPALPVTPAAQPAKPARPAAAAPQPGPKKPAALDFSVPAVMLGLFPKLDQVPATGQYVPQDALSLDFMDETYTTRYKVGGKEYVLFLAKRADEAKAKALAGEYAGFLKDFGKLVSQDSSGNMQFLVGEVSSFTDAVFQAGPFLGGVNAGGDPAVARDLALRLLRAVAAAAPALLPEPAKKLEKWPAPEELGDGSP